MDQALKLLGAVVGILALLALFADVPEAFRSLKWGLVLGGVCQAAVLFGLGEVVGRLPAPPERPGGGRPVAR